MSKATKPEEAKIKAVEIPQEIITLKADLKKIDASVKRMDEINVIVSDFKKKTNDFIAENEVATKENYPVLNSLVSTLRTTRTGLDNERKVTVTPLNNAVKVINSMYNNHIASIEEMEELIKPLKTEYDREETERKEKEKNEKLRLLTERIETMNQLGAKLEGGYYVIENPENPDDSMSFQAVEIQAMSSENWDKVQKLAGEIKDKIAKAEADRIAKAEMEKLEREEAERKLKEAQEQVINERFENRKTKLELMGFVEHEGKFFCCGICYYVDVIKKMDNDSFTNIVLEAKAGIEESKKRAEYDNRVSGLVQMGFKDEGTYYSFRSNGFKYDIDKKKLSVQEDYDFQVANFKSEKEASDKEQEEIAKKQREEAELVRVKKVSIGQVLNGIGMGYNFKDEVFIYNFTSPQGQGRPLFFSSKMSDVINLTDEEFANHVSNATTVIEQDKIDYTKHLEAQAELQRKANAEKQTDSQNIVSFASEVESLSKTVVIRNEDTKALFLKLCSEFTNSISKIVS